MNEVLKDCYEKVDLEILIKDVDANVPTWTLDWIKGQVRSLATKGMLSSEPNDDPIIEYE